MTLLRVGLMLIGISVGSQAAADWRLVVIDKSTSMSGQRMAEVRQELAEHLRRQPAAPNHPITFLTFDTEVRERQCFVDPRQAQQFVDSLVANGGGTSIAAGLNGALQELRSHADVDGVAVMLLTDDGDADRAAINVAESQLTALFSQRSDKGLSQAVLVRRWAAGGALDPLVKTLERDPNVQMVVGSRVGDFTPVTVKPIVKVMDAKIVGARVEAKLQLAVQAHGVPPGFSAPRLRFTATDRTNQANHWDIEAGAEATIVELPIAGTAEELRSGRTSVDLAISAAPKADDSAGKVLAVFPKRKMAVAVSFKTAIEHEWRVMIEPTGKSHWEATDGGRWVFECRIRTAVRSPGDKGPLGPVRIAWTIAPPLTITGGSRSVIIDRRQMKANIVSIAAPAPNGKQGNAAPPPSFDLLAEVVEAPEGAMFAVKKQIAKCQGLPTPKAVTRILFTPGEAKNARWWRAGNVAYFEVPMTLEVKGPVYENAQLMWISGNALRFKIEPEKFHTGTNHVVLRIAAPVPGGKADGVLRFGLQAPADNESIAFDCVKELEVPLPRLEPPRLVPSSGASKLSLTCLPWEEKVEPSISVELVGKLSADFQRGTQLRIDDDAGLVQPFTAAKGSRILPIRLQPTRPAPYFGYATTTYPFRVSAIGTGAVTQSFEGSIEVIQPGDFALHLTYALGVALLLSPFAAIGVVRRQCAGRDALLSDIDNEVSLP